MRYVLGIGVFLILLGVFLALTMREEPYDRMAFNPDDMQIPSELINPHGNILWVSVEGLRPDHMGVYGYENITTPRIDSFASESLVFERCYAQSTETYRSIATMLTSQYPSAYPSGSIDDAGRGFRDCLYQTDASFVACIRNAGHTTAAIVGSPLLKGEFGFSTGFDYYDDKPIVESDGSIRDRTTEETYMAAESWLSRNFKRPFFMFVHFPDPRGPYDAGPSNLKQLRMLPSYTNPKTLVVAGNDIRPLNALPAYHGKAGEQRSIGEMKRMYDAEIAEVDFYVGELLDTVSRLDISDETMVIISGAHGESLGEHSYYFANGGITYRNLTHVPLIIHNPGNTGGHISDVVEGIDIMPTISGYLNTKNTPTFAGMNLLRFYEKNSLKYEYPAFSCWDAPTAISVIKGDYELINFDDNKYMLFHIVNDPDEIYNLYTENDPTAKELKMLLEIWNRQNREQALDKEIKEKYGPPSHKNPMIIPQEVMRANPK